MTLRVAVAGLGVMGRNHVRVVTELDDVLLVGVCDSAPAAAQYAGRFVGAPFYWGVTELLAKARPDALIVAVPTQAHHKVVLEAVDRGIHVLVEKPIARTSEEARNLITHAGSANVALAVGHVERFNPAISALRRRLGEGQLGKTFQIAARRRTPFPNRVLDCGVVIDLATHDIDLMRFLLAEEPSSVYARTTRRIHSNHEDSLMALLGFPPDVAALLEADWVTPLKIRTFMVTGERGMFVAELLQQELTFYENDARAEGWSSLDTLVGVMEGDMTRFAIPREEPLAAELRAFLDLVAGHQSPTLASALDGLAAITIAEAMLRSAESGMAVSGGLLTGST